MRIEPNRGAAIEPILGPEQTHLAAPGAGSNPIAASGSNPSGVENEPIRGRRAPDRTHFSGRAVG
jgi:hypothetical protein